MSTNSAIEWTEATWNPVTGCTRVSAGCDHCYAVGMTHRLESMGQAEKYGGLTVLNNRGDRHFNGVVRCHEDAMSIPLRRKKPTMYFVNSMSDLFHKDVPFEFIDRVFAVMALCPQHTFQILTKRPERMAEYFANRDFVDIIVDMKALHEFGNDELATKFTRAYNWDTRGTHESVLERVLGPSIFAGDPTTLPDKWPLPNVWLLTSCEDQAAADERIPHLLRCPAAVRGLSLEPLIGEILLNDCDDDHPNPLVPCPVPGDTGWENRHDDRHTRCTVCDGAEVIDWVIVGGESGKGARPCDESWIRSIVEQCREAGVPCFVKQLGSHSTFLGPWSTRRRDHKGGDPIEWPEDLRVREMPKVQK